MDHSSFDRLTRLLGAGASRRHTLRAIVVAALAGGTADEVLAADKKKKRRGKGNGKSKRKRRNKNKGKNGSGCDRACLTDLADSCRDGRCVCGEEPACSGDDTCCEGACVDTDSDRGYCGSACGIACDSGETCITGGCVVCDGVVCGNECLPDADACCTVEDCEAVLCRQLVSCIERACVYDDDALNGTPCGLDGFECENGFCVEPD